MGYRERRMRYEQQLRELRKRGFGCVLLRKGILGFGVPLGAVMVALTLTREYFAGGVNARLVLASLLAGLTAAAVGGALFGVLTWRQSGRLEKTSPV